MVTLNTTWQEMSDDMQVYKEAFELIYKDKLVQELINKKILKRWIVGTNSRINRRDDYIFDLNTEFVIRNIIRKLYDKKYTYFVNNAKNITVRDLIRYACAILSKFIMIDKLLEHLWVFNARGNDYTFSVKFFEHYPEINTNNKDIDDVININYTLLDNSTNKLYDGFIDVQITAEDNDLFDLDCSKQLVSDLDFIKYNLPKIDLKVKAAYYENNTGNKINLFVKIFSIDDLVKELKRALEAAINLI